MLSVSAITTMRADYVMMVAIQLLILAGISNVATGQGHHRCPLGCRCDFEQQYKRIRCEPTDSGIVINFHDIDSDIHFLEILPRQRGRTDTLGPSLPDAFGDFPFLERLIIRNSGIKSVSVNAAHQLSKLRTLDLTQNEISSLRDLPLDVLSGLESLELSSNTIRSIESGDLRRLSILRSLGLSSNKIQSIFRDALADLQNLETLDLSANVLQDIPIGLLSQLRRLNYLDLSGNRLSAVPLEIQNLRSLTNLLLDDNQITSAPSSLVDTWKSSSIRALTLSNNPLQCDRSLSSFIAWVKTSDGSRKVCYAEQRDGRRRPCPACSRPRALAGLPVSEVNERDLAASSGQPDGSANVRPGGDGFVTFSVGDSGDRLSTGGANPRRDVNGVQRRIDDITSRIRRNMPGTGVECGIKKCYTFSAKGTRSWQSAQSTCRDNGMELAEINDPAEQKEVMSLLIKSVQENPRRSSPSRGWWIGFQYSPRRRELSYASSGQLAAYTNWANGRPNMVGFSQECVELWDVGQWNGGPCTLSIDNQFVCQTPLTSGQQSDFRNSRGAFSPQRGNFGNAQNTAFFTIVQ